MFKSNPIARALRKPGRRLLTALGVAALSLAPGHSSFAQGAKTESLDAVHAAFLFNFAKFTTWPAVNDLDTSIKFCIQSDTIGQEAFSGWGKKRIQNRPVRVAFFSSFTASELQNCSVMFLSAAPGGASLNELRDFATTHNTLLVSDLSGFGSNGGHIELYEANRRLRFRVNLGALEKARLSLGAGVLNLAEIVTTTGEFK